MIILKYFVNNIDVDFFFDFGYELLKMCHTLSRLYGLLGTNQRRFSFLLVFLLTRRDVVRA